MKSKGCQQLLHIYQNQSKIEEPLWRGGLSIANVCEDRDTAIHKLSDKHPQYSAKETELKAEGTGGPYKCTTLENLNPGGCDGCPNKNKVTSPVQIGKKLIRATEEDNIVTLPSVEIGREVTYTIPEYPFPYFRGRNGGVYKTGFTKEDGEEVEKDQLVFKYDFYVVKRMVDEELGEMIWLRVHMPKDGIREFAMPAQSLVASDEFKKIISRYGVIGTLKEMQAIMEYVTKFAQYLQDLKEAEKMRNQFGWCDDDTKFIIGDREISTEGVKYSPPSNQTIGFVQNFKPKGTLENWKRCVEVYGRPGNEARAFLFFTGFGAPLLKFTNQKGLLFSITENESGTGKTTIQRMANSIWGHPTDMMLIQRDTQKSQFHQMGVHNNIVICIDEITDMPDDVASALSYGVSQGRSNQRMKNHSNEVRINNTRWALPCLVSGNSNMHQKLDRLKATAESEQLRIVEVEIGADKTMSKADSDELFEHVLPDNYGHAGEILMEYIVANRESVIELLRKTQKRFDEEAKLSQKQRFYSAGAAMAFTGAMVAKELGLHDIDISKVWAWATSHFSDLKDSVKAATRNPTEAIGKFLNSHMRNILIVESNADKRTGLFKAPIKEPFGELLVRYEPDTKMIYIDSEAFQKWCTDRQIAYKSTIKELKRIADADITSKAMAKGTALSTPSVSVVRINDAELNLIDVEAITQADLPPEDD
jgi:putative DNA primase/helicase